MRYTAMSIDDPTLAAQDFDRAYTSPLSGVLADYVYNSLLTGRPYLLQLIEDAEIAARFARCTCTRPTWPLRPKATRIHGTRRRRCIARSAPPAERERSCAELVCTHHSAAGDLARSDACFRAAHVR